MSWDLKKVRYDIIDIVGIVFIDIVDIFDNFDIVDIVDIVDILNIFDIVDIVDIVNIVHTVHIVDCCFLKQSGTRLSSIEAISKTSINHPMSIMGLRDASASKNMFFINRQIFFPPVFCVWLINCPPGIRDNTCIYQFWWSKKNYVKKTSSKEKFDEKIWAGMIY